MTKFLKRIVFLYLAAAALVQLPLAMLLHVWTVALAFGRARILGAVVTLALPGLSELFWFWRVWSSAGTIWNAYCVAVFGYMVLLTTGYGGARIALLLMTGPRKSV